MTKVTSLAKTTTAAVALPSNPWSQLAMELEKYVGIPTLKFNKQGQYTLGGDNADDIVPEGTMVRAHINAAEIGWKKWVDGSVEKTRWAPLPTVSRRRSEAISTILTGQTGRIRSVTRGP